MNSAIVLFGHGSRDPSWRAPMDAVAERIRRRRPQLLVACAFLELQAPDLPSAVCSLVDQGATRLHVLPMFLGIGKHAREDLPALLESVRAQHPGVSIEAGRSVGERELVLDLLAELALQQL
jgi:sirohydrochlorin cobaltochelatase